MKAITIDSARKIVQHLDGLREFAKLAEAEGVFAVLSADDPAKAVEDARGHCDAAFDELRQAVIDAQAESKGIDEAVAEREKLAADQLKLIQDRRDFDRERALAAAGPKPEVPPQPEQGQQQPNP